MSDSAGFSTFNGDSTVGFNMARINHDASIAAASSEEVLGM